MKKLIICFLLFVCFKTTTASHLLTYSLTYQKLDSVTYVFQCKYLFECGNPFVAPSLPGIYMCAIASGCDTSYINLETIDSTLIGFGPCAFPFQYSCSSTGNQLSFKEYLMVDTVTLNNQCMEWVILSNSECCLTLLIGNLIGSTTKASIIYTGNHSTNNSPDYLFPPLSVSCLNLSSTHPFSATDVDGDSIVYEIASPYEYGPCSGGSPYTNATYAPPYDSLHPLSSTTPFSFNLTTGEANFTPDLISGSMFTSVVKEYRNGTLLSRMRRDEILLVSTTPLSVPELKNDFFNVKFNENILLIESLQNGHIKNIVLFDINGRLIGNYPYQQEINVDNLTQGVYLVSIATVKGSRVIVKAIKMD